MARWAFVTVHVCKVNAGNTSLLLHAAHRCNGSHMYAHGVHTQNMLLHADTSRCMCYLENCRAPYRQMVLCGWECGTSVSSTHERQETTRNKITVIATEVFHTEETHANFNLRSRFIKHKGWRQVCIYLRCRILMFVFYFRNVLLTETNCVEEGRARFITFIRAPRCTMFLILLTATLH